MMDLYSTVPVVVPIGTRELEHATSSRKEGTRTREKRSEEEEVSWRYNSDIVLICIGKSKKEMLSQPGK
jgi:hypothetical protein